MFRIEAIPKKLGAHYRSEPFESKQEAEAFRAEFLVDPEGTYFRIVRLRKARTTAESERHAEEKRCNAKEAGAIERNQHDASNGRPEILEKRRARRAVA